MTLYDIFCKLGVGGFLSVLVIVSGLIEVSPLKINPWQAIGKLVSKPLMDDLQKMGEVHRKEMETYNQQIQNLEQCICDLQIEVSSIKDDLQTHVAESMRRDILDFQNSCINKRRHTKEEFTYIYRLCDKYERYIDYNHLSNSEAEEAIHYIRTVYRECLENGEFIIKGEIKEEK